MMDGEFTRTLATSKAPVGLHIGKLSSLTKVAPRHKASWFFALALVRQPTFRATTASINVGMSMVRKI